MFEGLELKFQNLSFVPKFAVEDVISCKVYRFQPLVEIKLTGSTLTKQHDNKRCRNFSREGFSWWL